MIRRLLIGVLALVVLVVLWLASYVAAAESGEVVVLHAGDTETRLWVVDHDGVAWLRGSPGSGWMKALVTDADVVYDRGEHRIEATAEVVPEALDTINELMGEKYGLGHRYIGLFLGGWKNSAPVRLTPRNEDAS